MLDSYYGIDIIGIISRCLQKQKISYWLQLFKMLEILKRVVNGSIQHCYHDLAKCPDCYSKLIGMCLCCLDIGRNRSQIMGQLCCANKWQNLIFPFFLCQYAIFKVIILTSSSLSEPFVDQKPFRSLPQTNPSCPFPFISSPHGVCSAAFWPATHFMVKVCPFLVEDSTSFCSYCRNIPLLPLFAVILYLVTRFF